MNNSNEDKRIKKEDTSRDNIKKEESDFQINQEEEKNDESEESESSEFDVDMDRLTLIQVKEIVNKNRMRKEKKNSSFLSKKRRNPDTHIIFDS